VVDLSKASFDSLAPIPEWIPIGMDEETSAGEILVSFNLYSDLQVPERSLIPPTMDVNIEINILGLRGLKPALG